MTSIVPKLDTIEFEELVEQGQGLIPRYAPAWTDHNLHDPGITLIDLIAFLVDQQVYRIGFVGNSLKQAFTRLLGIEPRGPEAARLLIWPSLRGLLPTESNFSGGEKLTTSDIPDARFMVDAAVRIVPAAIAEITVVAGQGRVSAISGLSEGREPLVLYPAAGDGLRALTFSLTAPITPDAGNGYVSLGVAIGNDGETKSEFGNDVRWEKLKVEQWHQDGYWLPLETIDRSTGLQRSEVILFRPDTDVNPAPSKFRLRLDQGLSRGGAVLERISLNVLPAIEGWRDSASEICVSNGLPNQTVKFQTDNIAARDDLVILSDDSDEAWVLREDLSRSGPDDRHYRLTSDGIQFGNGINGMIVPAGVAIRHNPVCRTLGTKGAVAAGLKWQLRGQASWINFEPSSQGRDADSLDSLVRRARAVAKRRVGKLRSSELKALLQASGFGLADVHVLARRRPALDDRESASTRTILVVPIRAPGTRPGPASEARREAIEEALAPTRLLGESFHVSEPMYRFIDVEVKLAIGNDCDPNVIENQAEAILRQRLWDIKLSKDQKVAPWPPGRSVTISEMKDLMASLVDVVRVIECRVGVDGVLSRSPITLRSRDFAMANRIDVRAVRHDPGGAV